MFTPFPFAHERFLFKLWPNLELTEEVGRTCASAMQTQVKDHNYNVHIKWHSGKSVTIRKLNHASGVYKEHYV